MCLIIFVLIFLFISQFPVEPRSGVVGVELWAATLSLLAGGLVLGVVGAVMGVVNAATHPVGAVAGVPGLVAWNAAAGGCWFGSGKHVFWFQFWPFIDRF